jgi:hypothetical protein
MKEILLLNNDRITEEQITEVLGLTSKQEDFILLRENE